MPVSVALLILGGGIQGLALLRELVGDCAVILLDKNPGLSETRHVHCYFSSGWNAAEAGHSVRGRFRSRYRQPQLAAETSVPMVLIMWQRDELQW